MRISFRVQLPEEVEAGKDTYEKVKNDYDAPLRDPTEKNARVDGEYHDWRLTTLFAYLLSLINYVFICLDMPDFWNFNLLSITSDFYLFFPI